MSNLCESNLHIIMIQAYGINKMRFFQFLYQLALEIELTLNLCDTIGTGEVIDF